jgi:two-component system KDP operon response regulator KdpE
MAQRLEEPFRPSVAFVTHTRDYRSTDLLPALAKAGYTTTERPHDRETERLLRQFEPELVVLAVDPRQQSDIDLVGSIARASEAALLVLGPGPHSVGFATALNAGADVCVRDTDGAEIIAAQVISLARRRTSRRERPQADANDKLITVRDLTLDFDRCQAIRDTERIPLTPTEFKILAFLAKNAGKVVSPVEILRAVQEYTYSEREAQEIVKVYIRRIRRKVELDPAMPDYIVNVRGFGYMLERRGQSRGAETRAAA